MKMMEAYAMPEMPEDKHFTHEKDYSMHGNRPRVPAARDQMDAPKNLQFNLDEGLNYRKPL